ncbi:hypothetical protein [Nocardiopsis composta]|uniref:Thioesterase family protein n=1 Tax=Nocardiopsis composta TaxID=157465 RepID=A0A7W8QU05_9ACTN|nr:hypothetical protein [Nocardiopsis composta]MBB5435918.1 hypothetical protein [Nocardiopsis composta]
MTDIPGSTAPDKLTVDHRFNGPPRSANGGHIAGLLAARLGAPAARVTLRKPPPLDTAMAVEPEDGPGLLLRNGDDTVATVDPVPAGAVQALAERVPAPLAREASRGYRGFSGHPFPTCFVCGTDREAGDGLRIFAGPVPGSDGGLVAAPWTPDPSLAVPGTRYAGTEAAWAALDCPGGWSTDILERPMLLGRMTAEVLRPPQVGREHVVTGRRLHADDGRKVLTATALYDHEGALIAAATSIWIIVDTAAFSAAV